MPVPTSPEKVTEVIALYQQGLSYRKVSKQSEVPRTTCMGIVKRSGVDLREYSGERPRTHLFNKGFFKDIDSEEKAYILGLLFADGNIRTSGCVRISLQYSDREILEKACLCMGAPLDRVTKIVAFPHGEPYDYAHFEVNSMDMVADLSVFGCVSPKVFKIRLPRIREDLLRHFIRGYFDGDGSIYQHKQGHFVFDITGNPKFVSDVQELFLTRLGIKLTFKVCSNKRSRNISISNLKALEKVYSWLYQDATIYLERKYLKFQEFLKYMEEMYKKHDGYRIPDSLEELERVYNKLGRWTEVASYYRVSPDSIYYKRDRLRSLQKE